MIAGNLRNASLVDVIQVIATGGTSGVLQVDAGSSRARVYFEDGRLLYASLTPGSHVGEVLVRMDLLTAREVQEILAAQAEENAGAPLGYMAVSRGLITDADLALALERQVTEVLGELVAWREGAFVLTEHDVTRTYVPSGYRTDALRVLLRVAGHVAEGRDGRVTPSTVFVRCGDPTALVLPEGAWDVLGSIDGRRSARAIAAEVDLPVSEVYAVLARLAAGGVVQRVDDADAEPVVLVVGSSDALEPLLRLAIERAGARAVRSSTDAAALASAAAERPQAIVVDDAGGGWGTARALRRAGPLAHVPLLLVGGDRGGFGGLFKPARVETLAKPFEELALQQWLAGRLGRPVA